MTVRLQSMQDLWTRGVQLKVGDAILSIWSMAMFMEDWRGLRWVSVACVGINIIKHPHEHIHEFRPQSGCLHQRAYSVYANTAIASHMIEEIKQLS